MLTLVRFNPDLECHLRFAYELLEERYVVNCVNIKGTSDSELPSFEKHSEYLRTTSKYEEFWIIADNKFKGTVSLFKTGEVGIFVLSRFHRQGIGSWGLRELIRKCPDQNLFARINPDNTKSISLFTNLGWICTQTHDDYLLYETC